MAKSTQFSSNSGEATKRIQKVCRNKSESKCRQSKIELTISFSFILVIQKLSACVLLLCLALAVDANLPQVHPCKGRTSRFASDVRECRDYWRCFQGNPTRGTCPKNTFFHDARQTCVLPENRVCFQCPRNVPFQLRSVFAACNQFTLCFNGEATLHECQSGLVFDGRVGNCNHQSKDGVCHREDENGNQPDQSLTCPKMPFLRPMFIRVQNTCNA